MGTLFTIVGFVAIILGVVAFFVTYDNDGETERLHPVFGGFLLVLGAVIVFFSSAIVTIESDEVAVIFNSSTGNLVLEDDPGMRIVMPFVTDVFTYPIGNQNVTQRGSDAIQPRTSDLQPIAVDMTVIYRLDRNQVINRAEDGTFTGLHIDWGTRYNNELVVPNIRSISRVVFGQYSAQELYDAQESESVADVDTSVILEVQNLIEERLYNELLTYGITVESVLIRNIDFDDDYEQRVNQAAGARQELEQARIDAQTNETRANDQANVRQIAADAEAYEIERRAEAEGQAITIVETARREQFELLATSLGVDNVALIEYIDALENSEFIVVPQDGSTPLFFDLRDLADDTIPVTTDVLENVEATATPEPTATP